ncbi:hypothetical protein BCR44DRAFT_80754 [Catenaria anguillulae PL171]|uniref:Uncharacterized protein n=1 Tax=Catenaria anguillulae PL171 TaxID=765915 RepID=A0A1Y2I2T7_9FUNG|nr:hypothetical protein BCR44DRAFT_80754 [Catenaria anguillulae PL171]
MIYVHVLVILLVCTLASVAQVPAPPPIPVSVTSVVAKYRDDGCFKSAIAPNASTLFSALCPPSVCAPKIDEVITTYINSNDNFYALYGHILSFSRDMACYVPKPLATNSSGQGQISCVQQIGSLLGDYTAQYLAFFNGWDKPSFSYLRVWVNTILDLRRDTPATTACDPSTCVNKYLMQWHAWVKSLPDDFLNNMPAGNLLDKVDIKSTAMNFENDVVSMCKDTKFAVGGLAAQLEVDNKLPRKPAPKQNGAMSLKGMDRGELAVVMMTWVSVLAVMYCTALIM